MSPAAKQKAASPRTSSLAELRRASGVTLDQIESSTKIGKHFLRAIEEGRFDELPGGIISRSYVRQYASQIGCSAEPILQAMQPPAPQPVHSLRKGAQREAGGLWFRFLSLG